MTRVCFKILSITLTLEKTEGAVRNDNPETLATLCSHAQDEDKKKHTTQKN